MFYHSALDYLISAVFSAYPLCILSSSCTEYLFPAYVSSIQIDLKASPHVWIYLSTEYLLRIEGIIIISSIIIITDIIQEIHTPRLSVCVIHHFNAGKESIYLIDAPVDKNQYLHTTHACMTTDVY